MPQTTAKQKTGLFVLGIFLSLLILELLLRAAGSVLLFAQSQKAQSQLARHNSRRVLCIGESTTYLGYPEVLQNVLNHTAAGKNFQVINKGLPGTNSTLIVNNLPQWLAQYQPDYLVVMMGINDRFSAVPRASANWRERGSNFFRDLRIVKLGRWFGQSLQGAVKGKGPVHDERREAAAAENEALHHTVQDGIPPEDHPSHVFTERGLLLRDKKSVENEIEIFQAQFAKVPSNDQNSYYSALVMIGERRFKEAEFLLKALIAKNFSPEMTDWFSRKLAEAYYVQGKVDPWLDVTAKLLSMNSNHPLRNEWINGACADPRFSVKLTAFLKEEIRRNPTSGPLYDLAAGCLVRAGAPREAQEYFDQAKDLRLKYFNPVTRDNYGRLVRIMDGKNITVLFVQYPLREIGPLEQMVRGFPAGGRFEFVENKKNFETRLKQGRYEELFTDRFAGDFGHMTAAGQQLLAENIARKLLQ